MSQNSHLIFTNRGSIQFGLDNGWTFKAIAAEIEKDPSTVSKEVRKNSISSTKVASYRKYNPCIHRFTCSHMMDACDVCLPSKDTKKCSTCGNCRNSCPEFEEEHCLRLSKPPYVCNGCKDFKKCTLTKKLYYAKEAQALYEQRLSDSRTGINLSEDELHDIEESLVKLVKQQGQSIHHVCVNNADKFMVSEKTIYNFIDSGIIAVRNIDLPKRVRYRHRKSSNHNYKVDKHCLEGRRYEDFLEYIEENGDVSIVEIDSVEGRKGGKCLLTIHFCNSSFMLAFIRDRNDSRSVTDIFRYIRETIGKETFKEIFPVILADNGSEFSNPKAIEFDDDGEQLCKVFYCHPSSPYEKGACENNHELIRRICPKGYSFDDFNQKDINLMMSHINSYARPRLNNKTPFFVFSQLVSSEVAALLDVSYVDPNDIVLKPDLLKK